MSARSNREIRRQHAREQVENRDKPTEYEPDYKSGQSKHVRQQFMLGVNADQANQEKGKNAVLRHAERKPKPPVAGQEERGHDQFYDRVPRSDRLTAVAAAAAKQQPADHRNIVVSLYVLMTLRASR